MTALGLPARLEAADPPVRITSDVAYADRPEARLDVYQPSPAPAAPAGGVVLVHGGGWVGGDKAGEGLLGAAMARAGLVAFAVNYELAGPRHPTWPAAYDDVEAAVRWVKASAAAYGVDPARIGALGDSAGGHLVGLLATAASGPNDTGAGLRAAVIWSGPMDLVALDRSEAGTACPRTGPCLARGMSESLRWFMGCAPDSCPAAYESASPADRVQPGDPPLLLYNSTHELMPQAQASTMSVKLRTAGVSSRVVMLDGSQHGADYAARVTAASVEFLRLRLSGRPVPARAGSGIRGWWGWLAFGAVAGAVGLAAAAWRRHRSYQWF